MPDQNQPDPNMNTAAVPDPVAPPPPMPEDIPPVTTSTGVVEPEPVEVPSQETSTPTVEEVQQPAFMATDSPPPPPIIESDNPTKEEMEKKDEGEEKITPPSEPKKKTKGLVPGIIAALLLIAGLGAGVVLVRQQQDIRERAACNGGGATCRLDGDCCSGKCNLTGYTGTCAAPTGTTAPSCSKSGESCSKNGDCCGNLTCKNNKCLTEEAKTPTPTPTATSKPTTYKCDTSTGNCTATSDGPYTDVNQCENNCKKGGCSICSIGQTSGCNIGGVAGQTGTKTCVSLGVAGSTCGEWGECKATSTPSVNPTTTSSSCPYTFKGGGTVIAGSCKGSCPSGEWSYSYCKGKNVDTSQGCQDNMQQLKQAQPPSFPSSFCGVIQIDCSGNYQIAFQSRKDTSGCGTDGGGGESYQCLNVVAYDTNWTALSAAQLKTLKAGNVIRFAVKGQASAGKFDKAKFKINGQETAEITAKKPNTEEYYYEYTIPANVTSFTIDAKIHHDQKGWSN